MNNCLYTKYSTVDNQASTLLYSQLFTKNDYSVFSDNFFMNNITDLSEDFSYQHVLPTQPNMLISPFTYPVLDSLQVSPLSMDFFTMPQEIFAAPISASSSTRSSISEESAHMLSLDQSMSNFKCASAHQQEQAPPLAVKMQFPITDKKQPYKKTSVSRKTGKQATPTESEPTKPADHRNECSKERKAYSCDYCRRTFARQYDVARHSRIHTGAKPYVCPCCLQGFARSDARIRHFRTEINCVDGPKRIKKYKHSKPRPNLSL